MDAPNKLYLIQNAVNPKGYTEDVASERPIFSDDIEYIRKDAIVEYIKKELADLEEQLDVAEITGDRGPRGKRWAYESVLEKLNEL